MSALNPEILDLPTKEAVAALSDFYFEIQEAVGGVGSSKKIQWSVLAAAVLASMGVLEHSDLADLGADDHPQYHNDERGDLRYAPISIMTAPDPFGQYQQAAEVDAQIDAKVLQLKAEPDPFPVYETSVEAQAKVDAKMAQHLAAPDPHPQYASNAELDAKVTAAVAPIAEEQVADYIASQGQNLIEAAVAEQVTGAVNDAIAAHVAAPDPHPQYQLKADMPKNTITNLTSVAGAVEIDLSLGDYFYVELTEDTIVTIINPPPAGIAQSIYVQFKQDAVGGWAVTLPAEFKANGGSDTVVADAAEAYTDLAATTMNSGVRWAYSMQEQV